MKVICLVFLTTFYDWAQSKKSGTSKKSLGKIRILSELREIHNLGISTSVPFNTSNDECGVRISALKGNLLEVHFSFTGVEGSPYCGGIYHGRIRLHPDYPRKVSLL
jgi:ubiquitin-protein ligase